MFYLQSFTIIRYNKKEPLTERKFTMKQKLYALLTNKGIFISTRQFSDNEVSIYEHKKVYRSDIYDEEKELLEMKEQIEKGDEYWVYHFPKDILPLHIYPFYFESEEDTKETRQDFEIIDWVQTVQLEDRIEVTLQVAWSSETMKEMQITEPYIIVPITKYGTLFSPYLIRTKENEIHTTQTLQQKEVEKIERYILRNENLLESAHIYRPKSQYDYFEKDSSLWAHVYEIEDNRVRYYIANKDWENGECTIEEFMDKYDTKNPLTNNE